MGMQYACNWTTSPRRIRWQYSISTKPLAKSAQDPGKFLFDTPSSQENRVVIGRGRETEEGAKKNAQEELLTDWIFTCCDCVDRGFPESEGGTAKRNQGRRLTKIPPRWRQRCYQKTRKKKQSHVGVSRPYQDYLAHSESRNRAWKAAKTCW